MPTCALNSNSEESRAGNRPVESAVRSRENSAAGHNDGNWNPSTAVQTRRKEALVRKAFLILLLVVVCAGAALAQGPATTSSPQSIRPIAVVTKLQQGVLTLNTDAG